MRYEYHGSVLYAYGIPIGSDGSVTFYYGYDADSASGTYVFTGIRNSDFGGAYNSIHTTVVLCPSTAPSISHFYASPSQIDSGGHSYLYWGSSGAKSATINGQSVGTSGSLYVSPSNTTNYTLRVYSDCYGSASSSTTVTVNPYNASFDSQEVDVVTPGASVPVSIRMRNAGTASWSGTSFRLCSIAATDWGVSCVSLQTGESVPPGGIKDFSFNITAPGTSGNYDFQWRMQRSGVWFGSPSAALVLGDYPEPTSMNFSPNMVAAGNGSSLITVGNGANMTIDLEYRWSGDEQLVTVPGWRTLNSDGQTTLDIAHCTAQGTYTYTRIKNSQGPDDAWTDLHDVTFIVNGPQPEANSLTISPSAITPMTTQPGQATLYVPYTIRLSNAGGITTDTRYEFDGMALSDIMGWPSFDPDPGGPTCGGVGVDGISEGEAATCTAVGTYTLTGMKNTTASTWVPQNSSLHVSCPGSPHIISVSPVGLTAGIDTQLTITGTNLCSVSQLLSSQGITFSNLAVTGDPAAGVGMSATARSEQSLTIDVSAITMVAPCAIDTDNAAYVTQSVPTTMVAGQAQTVSVTLDNTGNTTWTGSGYHLGSQNPAGNAIWGLSNVALVTGESVTPGHRKTFTFNVTAPASAGTYHFQWQMVGGGAWFGDRSLNVDVNVVPASDAVFVSQTPLSDLVAGQTYPVSVTFRNTGAVAWTATDEVQLGSQNPADNSIWGISRVALVPGEVIAPGEDKTFTFNIIAQSAGTYNFQWQMLKGSNGWFGVKSTNQAVSVSLPPFDPGTPKKEYIYINGRLIVIKNR